jgi:23S rRNA (guanine2445-N2)-methyltransferase / 23S rRNA (guanine2069-N7)-methyltransferase
MMKPYNLVASCAGGVESLVTTELSNFGVEEVESSVGVVTFRGDLATAYRCCLWSRFGSRIFLELAAFTVENEESLYRQALTMLWQKHLDPSTTFAINCTISGKSPITNNRYAALKVKDGLVDFFRARCGDRPTVKGQRPDLQLHLHIDGNRASIFVDMSGESLHRRGYRAQGTVAPLKETLAAAIVALSGWPKRGGALVDPMCGSGTLLIEAALMFGDSAPGLSRNYFGFFGWKYHQRQLWHVLVEEALARENAGRKRSWPVMQGYDSDPVVISAARRNISGAGLGDRIQVKLAELATLRAPTGSGTVLSNLPYGERLSEFEFVARLYKAFGRILKKEFPGWNAGAFISDPQLTDSFGISWDSRHKLFNGSLACRLLTGVVAHGGEKVFRWQLAEQQSGVECGDFGNRLKKNLKKIWKWADRENIRCYRVYDKDLPEYNLSVDVYAKWIHVQEYAPPKTVSRELAASRMSEALGTLRQVLGVRSNRIFVKRRERQTGKKQYQKKNSRQKLYEVVEGPCTLLVNFTDYLDTGLFLDHRPLRQRIHDEARGKRFLNLYGYTASASVHAAMGGAASTTTVDLSQNYLHWASLNFAVNGLSLQGNLLVQADCLQWLQEHRSKYDLIFIDPPTFSNTKKDHRVFDVQRDHLLLIELAMERLERAGLLLFSTNYKRFALDESLMRRYLVTDISAKTIPFDFSRNKKIHSCWEIRRELAG